MWSIRAAAAAEPVCANQLELSSRFARNRGDNVELEYRYAGGTVRALVYNNHADMGSYAAALASSGIPDVTATRGHRAKAGAGISVEQVLGKGWGGFGRFSFADGHAEAHKWLWVAGPGVGLRNVPYVKGNSGTHWASGGQDLDWLWLKQHSACQVTP